MKNIYNISFYVIYIIISYLFINNDFRIGGYDVEPDYISGIFLIETFGHPLYIYHPGTIHYYFVWLIFKILSIFKINLVTFIIVCRSFYFSLGLLIIKFSKIKKEIVITSLGLALFFSKANFLGLISGDTLNFFLTFLLIGLLIRKNNILAGIIFGIMLNIKFTALLLLPFCIYELFSEQEKKVRFKNIWKFLIFSIPFAFIHGILSLELIFYPLKITLLRIFKISEILHSTNFWFELSDLNKTKLEITFYVFVTALIILSYWYIIKSKFLIKFLNSKNLMIYLSSILFLIISILYLFDYQNIRLVLILIPASSVYLFHRFKVNKSILTPFIFLLFLFLYKEPVKYNFNTIDNYIINSEKPILFFSPSGSWVSEINFLLWAKFEGLDSFEWPEYWVSRYGKDGVKNIYYLNSENIDCKDQILEVKDLKFEERFNLNRKLTYKDCVEKILEFESLKILVPRGFNNDFKNIKSEMEDKFYKKLSIDEENESFFVYKISS